LMGAAGRAYASQWEDAADAISNASSILGASAGAAALIGLTTGAGTVGAVSLLGKAAAYIGGTSAAVYWRSGVMGNSRAYGKAYAAAGGAVLDGVLGWASGITVKAAGYGRAFYSTSAVGRIKAAYGHMSYVVQSTFGLLYAEATEKKK
jgi:hypothetical protein